MIRLTGLKQSIDSGDEGLGERVSELLKIDRKNIRKISIVKKSVDARKKDNIFFVYTVDVETSLDEKRLIKRLDKNAASILPAKNNAENEAFQPENAFYESRAAFKREGFLRPVIVGFGPAGMFAAWYLSRLGLRPLVIERGDRVEERKKRVEELMEKGVLDTESNIQFGEGGAGTFSDGKLTTGIKSPLCALVLELFNRFGAPDEILYQQRPHIGTDILHGVVKNMRHEIERLGGEICFRAKLCDIHYEDSRLVGISYTENDEIKEVRSDRLILATGHSARDLLQMLYKKGVKMLAKPFSVGFRIEHPQRLIDRAQYGRFAGHKNLPVAEYHLSMKSSLGRGVYSFCMCPGGTLVPAASEKDRLCTNGMSVFKRDAENANSAILVDVRPDDFGGESALEGIAFQRELEKRAYIAGGGGYAAPVQLVGDFLNDRASSVLGRVRPSYKPSVKPSDFRTIFPGFAIEALKEGLLDFDKKLKGFAMEEAVLTAVESRSSCPVRIMRDEKLQTNISGLYPAGEGAGYAGGIMSAAVDGLKCAMQLARDLEDR